MNININKLFTSSLPFIAIFTISFAINKILYINLPKQSIEHVKDSLGVIEYKNYEYKNSFFEHSNKMESAITNKKEYALNENIILQAIYQLGDNDGFAMVLEKGNTKVQTVSINETFNGYKLINIKPDYVLFEKATKTYKLTISNNTSQKSVDNIFSYENQGASDEPIVIKKDETSYQLEKKDIALYTKDIKKIWNDIKIDAKTNNGSIVGFEIKNVKPNSVFSNLGLTRGDIIVEANGVKLNNYQNAFRLYNKINTTSLLKLKIQRNQKEMEIEYEIK